MQLQGCLICQGYDGLDSGLGNGRSRRKRVQIPGERVCSWTPGAEAGSCGRRSKDAVVGGGVRTQGTQGERGCSRKDRRGPGAELASEAGQSLEMRDMGGCRKGKGERAGRRYG